MSIIRSALKLNQQVTLKGVTGKLHIRNIGDTSNAILVASQVEVDGNPTSALQVATKQYVDGITGVGAATSATLGTIKISGTPTDANNPVTYVKEQVDTLLGAKANTSHTHNIGDLNTTGTANNTTFLRGDGAWATPASGGMSASGKMSSNAGTKTAMPTGRYNAGYGLINNKFYMAGGTPNGSSSLSAVEEYDPVTDTWTTKSNTGFTARFGIASCVVNGKLHTIAGGVTNHEAYDPNTNTWTTLSAYPVATRYSVAISVGNWIYVFGGFTSSAVASAYKYDTTNDAGGWTALTSLPAARMGMSAVTDGTYIWLFAGNSGTGTTYHNTTWKYDPANDAGGYTVMAVVPSNRTYTRAVRVGNIAYIMGYYNAAAATGCETYNLATDTWGAMADLPTARHSGAAFEYNGSIYYVGGGGTLTEVIAYRITGTTRVASALGTVASRTGSDVTNLTTGRTAAMVAFDTGDTYGYESDTWTSGGEAVYFEV